MIDDLKKELSSVKLLSILLTIAVGIYLVQVLWQLLDRFSDVFIILIISWLLSFVLEPVVESINKGTRLNKTASALATYFLVAGSLFLIVLLFIPVVLIQLEALSKVVPVYLETAPRFIQKWNNDLISSLDSYITYIPSVANFFFSVFVILIISFYLIVDKEKINKEFFDLAPVRWHKSIKSIQKIIDDTFASFLRVQLIFGVTYGFITWLILRLFNVDFAASTALISGVLTLIPLVGPIFGIIPPIFISFISDPSKTLLIFALLLIIQQVIFNIWGPKFMGKTFKVHPIIILLSFFIGFKIAGIMGAILAIPVISIITIAMHDLGHLFISSRDE